MKRVDGGASPKTANLEIGTLRAILKRSGQWARLQPEVEMLPTQDDVGRAITPKEESALLQACGKSRSRSLVPFVTLAIETGARYGTIRTLQWENVDFERRDGRDGTRRGERAYCLPVPRSSAHCRFPDAECRPPDCQGCQDRRLECVHDGTHGKTIGIADPARLLRTPFCVPLPAPNAPRP